VDLALSIVPRSKSLQKRLYLELNKFEEIQINSNPEFPKKKHQMSDFSASTCTIEYVETYKSGIHLQTEEKNALEQCCVENC
jgi:hypothetical protein